MREQEVQVEGRGKCEGRLGGTCEGCECERQEMEAGQNFDLQHFF